MYAPNYTAYIYIAIKWWTCNQEENWQKDQRTEKHRLWQRMTMGRKHDTTKVLLTRSHLSIIDPRSWRKKWGCNKCIQQRWLGRIRRQLCQLLIVDKIVIIVLPCLTPATKASLILGQVVSTSHVPTIRDYTCSVVIFGSHLPAFSANRYSGSHSAESGKATYVLHPCTREQTQILCKAPVCSNAFWKNKLHCILPDSSRFWFWMILMLNDPAWTATPGCTQVFQVGCYKSFIAGKCNSSSQVNGKPSTAAPSLCKQTSSRCSNYSKDSNHEQKVAEQPAVCSFLYKLACQQGHYFQLCAGKRARDREKTKDDKRKNGHQFI